ncbi:MAG TPA: homocysteine methyltransferase, partial [Paenibacillaceae bacterium]|nr:homocysteine methyltransferase [Paenibacillaceae bacterium]
MKAKICDTTLRDGEQAAGVVFTFSERQKILEMMAKSGVDQAEVGIPAMGEDEVKELRKLAQLNYPIVLSTWNRAVREDLNKAYQTGIKRAHVSIPTSPVQMKAKLGMNPRQVKERIRRAVAC